ncbi:putative 17 kDa surface antigen precursor [Candidatus Methylomirabilis oxygeniifera]|uniref:Putative 17 kDa surface antigen n=1 Tax=Methylomirabilis oxygeniifera TaxID=671143 RepID=D5MFI4_METO1|nr:putative 17 kDa surface antigen precursor [Candidatus Methylomirabilis oxyfera]
MQKALSLRQGVALLLCLFLVTGGTFGCAAIEEQVKAHPETALGTGIGVAAGMLTGGLIFGNAAGTLVGGLLGGLTGGVIGNVVEARSWDRSATSQRYHYSPTQGTMLRIEAVEAHPAQIRPGDTINLNMRFAVLAPNIQHSVQVSERRQILFNSSPVGNSTLQIQRMGGTWTSSQPLTLPANAATGSYRVIMSVKADGTEATQQTTFTVVR